MWSSPFCFSFSVVERTIIITLSLLALCTTVAQSFHCLPTTATTFSNVLKSRSSIQQASLLVTPRPRISCASSVAAGASSTIAPAVRYPSFCRVRGGAAASSSAASTAAATGKRTTVLYSTTTTANEERVTMAKISTAASSMTPAAKLTALRARMKELNLDVYLVPSDDPHLSGTYRM
jgi:hypothetical protein